MKFLLSKAEAIFLNLDHENSLVLSCLEYIRRLSRMCGKKGSSPTVFVSGHFVNTALEIAPDAASAIMHDNGSSSTGSADAMSFNLDNMDPFQLFASEMFDPAIFEHFHQSPVDGMSFVNGLWEGFPCGG